MNYLTYFYFRLIHVCQTGLLRQFTLAGLGVLACLVISGVAGLETTQNMSHLLFCFSFILLAIAAVGRRWAQYAFRATRILPRFGTIGEPLQYQVVIHNLTLQAQKGLKLEETFPPQFPSFREFKDIKARYFSRQRWSAEWRNHVLRQQQAITLMQDLPDLSAETKTKVKGEIIPLHRGRLSLEAITLACPDPLGLLYKRQRFVFPQSVCILPKRYELPPLALSRVRRHQMGQTSSVPSIGEALEFRSLRDYRPGDPTSKIHWKSWAKVGRPIIREQQDESTLHHALIIDSFQPESYSEIFEEAIKIAVSFLTQKQPEESLLDVIFADSMERCVTVGRGLRQRAQILETLATLASCPDRNLHCLTPALQSRIAGLSGCFCIFISLDETRYDFLKMLVQQGIPTKAVFLHQKRFPQMEWSDFYLSPQCCTHFVSIGNVQQELLSI